MKMLRVLAATLGATFTAPALKMVPARSYSPAKGKTDALKIRRAAVKTKNRKAAK